MASKNHRHYVDPERLADVMALIQVLALDPNTHRSEDGLKSELQGPPKSSASWRQLAIEHPEFFRVRAEGEHIVSLIARHVQPKEGPENKRKPLSTDFIGQLLESAINLHDRAVRRRESWTSFVPLGVALIAGIFSLGGGVFLGQRNSSLSRFQMTVLPAPAGSKIDFDRIYRLDTKTGQIEWLSPNIEGQPDTRTLLVFPAPK